MANRYWVGGTGTWDTSTTNWSATSGGASGASAPTTNDSVFFDQAGTYTVTLTGVLACNDITVSAGTVTFTGTGTITASGSMSLVSDTVWNATGLLTFRYFIGGQANRTVTTNSVTLSCSVTFTTLDSDTPSITLGSALTLTGSSTFTINRGVLNLAGFTLTTGIFSSSSASTRSITFGSSNIVLIGTSGTVLSMATGTNFSCTGTGGFVADAAFARTFTIGLPTVAPNLTFTGSGTQIQTVNAYVNTLDFGTTAFAAPVNSGMSGNSLILSNDSTYTNFAVTMTGTGTLDCKGKTIAELTVNHPEASPGTTTLASSLNTTVNATTTLTSGTLNLAGFTLTTGIFSSSPNPSYARSVAFGTGNIVLTHTTAGTTVLSMATATGFTVSGTGGFFADASVTRTYAFGFTAGGSIANAPNLTFTGSGTSVQTLTTGSYFNTLNFGTTAFNPGTTALNLNGLSLSATGTYTTLSATMRGTGTVTGNGNTTLTSLVINSTSGTTTLGSALTLTTNATTTLTSGTLDLAGFTLTTGIFFGDGTTTRSIAFGTGNIVLAHTTAATVVLNMPTATGFTCTGTGGFTASAAVTRTYSSGSTSGG